MKAVKRVGDEWNASHNACPSRKPHLFSIRRAIGADEGGEKDQ